jgi:hypothetical protein
MRPFLLLLLSATLAHAQLGRGPAPGTGNTPTWTLGIQKAQPSLALSLHGSRNGLVSDVDAEADLGLGRSGTPMGVFGEYQGLAHGFLVSYDTARTHGDGLLSRDIFLNGTRYGAGTRLATSARIDVFEGLWTLKLARRPDAWLGLDLGAQLLRSDLRAEAGGAVQTARPAWWIPQVGLTGFSSGLDGLLESRAFVRYFTHRGARSYRYGLDARAYLYPSFGLRAFFEEGRMRIPPGSLRGDLDIRAERRVAGLGLVFRF